MKLISDHKVLFSILIAVLVINQIAIFSVSRALGVEHKYSMGIFQAKTAMAMEIMMPIPNEDGKTTHLKMMPTITEVPGEPGSGDVVADAMVVMMAKGTPFYAPAGISFDDPVGSLQLWHQSEKQKLSPDDNQRYQRLIGLFPCNFCCGSPTSVTFNGRCGCAHAKAARGFFKYMLQNFGDKYTDEQLFGEAYRWQAIWYPSGVVEDYLLATGRGDAIGHKPHGGAGSDGFHGLQKQ
ncbi:MAG: hypothetical protein NUV82_03510 [Candidatus Komeilibacteria bacterium]|nr:hypothetical protein [Candidatus Komeilibacteria bacterium]